jgi:hypothetical protein
MNRSKEEEDRAWRTATWEGAAREAMRRWAELPLERIIAAQEEMREITEELGKGTNRSTVSED